MPQYVIGIDFGTDSVRAALIDTSNGDLVSSSVHWYKRYKSGLYCNPSINQFRQHPVDHIEGMEASVKGALESSGINRQDVVGICIDTTGSSPLALNDAGISLALTPEFADNPNDMMILWKDHTSIAEAEGINQLAASWPDVDYTNYVGGVYSSEWFWAKIWHVYNQDPAIRKAAYTWMEHCDYMTYLLVGGDISTFKRSRCAAGHKAMWHTDWDGLPPSAFLHALDPDLGGLRSRLYQDTYTSDQSAGTLCPEWADRLGLSLSTVVAVGTFDAHAGAVGAEIQPNTLVKVMGTSTCDILVTTQESIGNSTIKGICGQVDGSVIPHMIGLEAGQSAFGDLLAWWKEVLMWPIEHLVLDSNLLTDPLKSALSQEVQSNFLTILTAQAEKISPEESLPIALDWINGRRTPFADQTLKCTISQLSLGSMAPQIFRALVESICFG